MTIQEALTKYLVGRRIVTTVHDGHTTFNGHPITEWVRHHAKENHHEP